jgi:hypothetical protein
LKKPTKTSARIAIVVAKIGTRHRAEEILLKPNFSVESYK